MFPRVWACPGEITLGAGLVASLVAPRLVHELRYVPLLASLVVLGVPHGAVDHLIPGWVDAQPSRTAERGRRRRLIAGYVALTLGGVLVWLTDPVIGLGLFLLAAVAHWGSADLAWSPGVRHRVGFAAVRGAIPVLWPAVAYPRADAAALQMLLAPFHPGLTIAPLPGLARGVLAGLIVAAAAGSGAGAGTRERLETIGLLVVFSLVDPVAAVGLYFIAWHSWRHVVRLAAIAPAGAERLRAGHPAAAVGVVLRAAIPCTVVALAGIAALAAALSVAPTAWPELIAPALALIAALTVPHSLLVAWLDHRGPGGVPAPRPARPRRRIRHPIGAPS